MRLSWHEVPHPSLERPSRKRIHDGRVGFDPSQDDLELRVRPPRREGLVPFIEHEAVVGVLLGYRVQGLGVWVSGLGKARDRQDKLYLIPIKSRKTRFRNRRPF